MNDATNNTGQVLKGHRAIISAGAAGIGRSIADTLITAGAKVAVFDVSEDAVQNFKQHYPTMSAQVVDVSNFSAVDAFFDDVLAEFDGLDILVNNAGIAGPTGGVEEIHPAEWDRTIAVNLSVLRCLHC